MSKCREVFLTFDVEGPPFMEDFMDQRVLKALLKILRLLEKYEMRGLFFITGSVAEKIGGCSEILELLEGHCVGYHSSSHSVRPMIFEYTDVENYDEAVEISLKRETSRVDPSTGRILGEGGILSLREIFPDKKIESFRAPFLCWTPPHLEALRELGLKFDFSAGLSQNPTYRPVHYKGITFYPRPIPVDSRATSIGYIKTFPKKHILPNFLLSDVAKGKCAVLMKHPAVLAYRTQRCIHSEDDALTPNLTRNKPRVHMDLASQIFSTELLFLELNLLQKIGLAEVTPPLKIANTPMNQEEVNLKIVYNMSLLAPKRRFGFKPRFLLSHFHRFFDPFM